MPNLFSRFKNDKNFRTVAEGIIAIVINVAYAVYNGYYGIKYISLWYISLAVYFLLLSLMRSGVLISCRCCKGDDARKIKTFLATGIMLLIVAMALSGVVVMMSVEGRVFERAGLLIYVAALYTVVKITSSIINISRTKKQNDYAFRAFRDIGLADAVVSVLVLQTAMLVEFNGGSDVGWGNAATGSVVCVFTIGLGLFMIINASLKLKRLKENENG